MRRTTSFVVGAFFAWAIAVAAQVTINYTFTAGTVADPDQVNDNFSQLSTKALNRTGGTVTGALTSAGGSLAGTWTGTPTMSGNWTFSGTPTFSSTTTFTGAPTFNAAATFNNNVTFGDAAADTITATGTFASDLKFTDATYDIGKSGATRPRDGFFSRNLTVGSTSTLAGATFTGDLLFTDATYDIGKTAATRPRDGFFSRNLVAGGTLGVTGVATFTAQDVHSAGVDLSSNGQVVFPATQNASAGANTLDDYEEGNWTPVLGGSGGTSGQTYTTATGRYIKLGQLVFCSFYIDLSNKGTITSNLQIQGLPFTSQNVNVGGLAISYFTNMALNTVFVGGLVDTSATTATVYMQDAADGGMTISTTANVQNGSILAGTITYRAVN